MVLSIWKAVLSCALNVEGKDSKRRQLGPLTLAFQLANAGLVTVNLHLTARFVIISNCVLASFDFEPRHPSEVFIHHESEGIGNI